MPVIKVPIPRKLAITGPNTRRPTTTKAITFIVLVSNSVSSHFEAFNFQLSYSSLILPNKSFSFLVCSTGYDNWKLKASKWELTEFDTKTIIVIALVVVGLLVFGPVIASFLGIGTLITGIATWLNNLITNAGNGPTWLSNLIANAGNGREMEINIEDVMQYAKTVYKAINK